MITIELHEYICPECGHKLWLDKEYQDEDGDFPDVLRCALNGTFQCMSSDPEPTGRFIVVELEN